MGGGSGGGPYISGVQGIFLGGGLAPPMKFLYIRPCSQSTIVSEGFKGVDLRESGSGAYIQKFHGGGPNPLQEKFLEHQKYTARMEKKKKIEWKK